MIILQSLKREELGLMYVKGLLDLYIALASIRHPATKCPIYQSSAQTLSGLVERSLNAAEQAGLNCPREIKHYQVAKMIINKRLQEKTHPNLNKMASRLVALRRR